MSCRTLAPLSSVAPPHRRTRPGRKGRDWLGGGSNDACRARRARCCVMAAAGASGDDGVAVDRRRVLLGAASFAVLFDAGGSVGAAGAAELSKEYKDEEDLYSFKVPGDWEMALAETDPTSRSTRRVVAFYPPGMPEVNVNVVCTGIGADYQKMGSFGSPDDFAFGVAAGMTRPKPKVGPKQFSYVVNAKSAGDKYVIEYTVERPSEEFHQHLLSSVGIGYNGRVSRLFTMTAVCPEEQYEAQKDVLTSIINTFETPLPLYS